jgi:hypothetical protein
MFTQHKLTIITALITAILAGGGGYTLGRADKTPIPSNNSFPREQFAGRMNTGGMPGGMRAGNGFINGSIIARDNESITIRTRGINSEETGSKIIYLASSTQISKFTEGNIEDLAVGTSVVATGTGNADGSMVAQTIQTRPADLPSPGMR